MIDSIAAEFVFALVFEPPAVAALAGAILTILHRRRLGRAFWPALLGFVVLLVRKLVEFHVAAAELRDDLFALEYALDAAWSVLLTAALFLRRRPDERPRASPGKVGA